MSGTVTDLGNCTAGQIAVSATINVGARVSDLNAQLVAAGSLKVALDAGPPTMSAAVNIGAMATANAIASVTAPYFGLQITANAAAIAALQAQLALMASIVAALGTAGVYLYQYSGTADSFGTALQSVVGPGLPGGLPADHIDAIALVASTPAAWQAMQVVFKTS